MSHGAFVNSWIPNLANLSETRTLCQFCSSNPMFSVIYLFFVPTDPNFLMENFLFIL